MSISTIIDKEILNRFLEHASPDVVYDWLESNASKLWEWFDGKPTTELMLIERKEPLIDLALALFSKNEEIRNTLYDRGDSTLQKAVLTNKNCRYFPALENLLKEEKTDYLEILLINTENRLFLVDLFKKKNLFSEVKKSYWLKLLEISSRNKILTYPYSKDDYEWDDEDDTVAFAARLYRSVYELFDALDANNKNAALMSSFVTKLPWIENFDLVHLDVSKMIEKWQNKEPVQHSDYVYFHEHENGWEPTADEKFAKIENKCWTEWDFVTCRTHLANHFYWSSDYFKDNEDIALRIVYYRNENFNWHEKKSSDLIENWRKYYEKDNLLFTGNLIKNNSIYWNKKIINYIGDAWMVMSTYCVEEYLEKLEKFKQNNPEEFIDNSQIQNIELELHSHKKELYTINTKIEENKRMLLEQKTTSFIIIFLLVSIVFIVS